MPEPVSTLTFWIIMATGVVSFIAFQRPDWQEKLVFWPEQIFARKEHYRLLTHGFIHGDWLHLAFNMYTLYAFGQMIELFLGAGVLAAIYFSSIIGGGLLSLFVHRHHDYRALGASGGVSGVIFAHIFLFPGGHINMLFLPVGMPSWLYAILFILLSFYGMRSGRDNIGHDAHIGGAIVGLLVTTAIAPRIVANNPWLFGAVLGLSTLILLFLIINPLHLPWAAFTSTRAENRPRRPPQRVAQNPGKKAFDMDAILDKISRDGVQSLTQEEHQFLLDSSRSSKSDDIL